MVQPLWKPGSQRPSKNVTENDPVTQQFHFWEYQPKERKAGVWTEARQHQSQRPKVETTRHHERLRDVANPRMTLEDILLVK